jgi:periplasmic protein TonB
MNTANTAHSALNVPYVLSNPVAVRPPRVGPILLTVILNGALILGLSKGLGVMSVFDPPVVTHAFSVPDTTQPQEPIEDIPPPEPNVAMSPIDIAPPTLVVEPDIQVSVDTPTSITVDTQPAQPNAAADTPLTAVKLLRQVEPPYPPMSKRLDEQGTVVMRLTILSTGRVSRVDVTTSSGYARLDQAAKDAARQWLFARRDGANVMYTVTVPMKFRLDEMR